MKWTKPSAETVEYFERIAPGPPIEARTMFGMPSRFLNGHMLVSVFGNSFMLHLSETDRAECIAAGARPFAPHGRSAAEYVEVTRGMFEDRTLKEWIARGMRYLGTLPPKLGQDAKLAAEKAKANTNSEPPRARPAKATVKVAKAVKAKVKAKPAKALKAKMKAKPAKAVKAKMKAKPAKSSVKAATKKTKAKTKRAGRTVTAKARAASKRPSKKPAARKPRR